MSRWKVRGKYVLPVLLSVLLISLIPGSALEARQCSTSQDPEIRKDIQKGLLTSAQSPFAIGAMMPLDKTPMLVPPFTEDARKAEFEGNIYVELIIHRTGKVARACVLSEDSYGLGREAAKFYVSQKQFEPSTLNNEPLSVKMVIPIRYRQ
jgi:hypothetical protein